MYNTFVWRTEKLLNKIFQRMLFSNNTLHVMFYTYICYWNIFQYKSIIQLNSVHNCFSCRKTISCAIGFKIYLFNLYHIISLPILVLSRLCLISLSSSPPLLFNWPRMQFPWALSRKLINLDDSCKKNPRKVENISHPTSQIYAKVPSPT